MKKLVAHILLSGITFFNLNLQSKTVYGDIWGMDHMTPLMKASKEADIEKMKELIQAGANVNDVAFCDQPHCGYPVLRYAINSHSLAAVQILLEAGANPNKLTDSAIINTNYESNYSWKANIRNLSLLSHAINSHAPIAIIEALIQKGANIDGTPKLCGDWSALMVAAYRGYTQAVVVLLNAGANPSEINSMDNKTALDYAKEEGHTEIIALLEKQK